MDVGLFFYIQTCNSVGRKTRMSTPVPPLKGRFHEPTNQADKKQNTADESKIGWWVQINWSADQYSSSLHCTVVANIYVANQLNFFIVFYKTYQLQNGAHVHSLMPIRRLDPETNFSWSAADFLLFHWAVVGAFSLPLPFAGWVIYFRPFLT